MYKHRRPDGRTCVFLCDAGKVCFHCGSRVGISLLRKDMGSNDMSGNEVRSDIVNELREVPTSKLVDVLRARGAEVGDISVGGVVGTIVILRDGTR